VSIDTRTDENSSVSVRPARRRIQSRQVSHADRTVLSPLDQPTLRVPGDLFRPNRQYDPNQPVKQPKYIVMIARVAGRKADFELGHHADLNEPAINPWR
jgi:hypothetical protein